jgi:hypothetical protein
MIKNQDGTITFEVGDRVKHEIYGNGTVVDVKDKFTTPYHVHLDAGDYCWWSHRKNLTILEHEWEPKQEVHHWDSLNETWDTCIVICKSDSSRYWLYHQNHPLVGFLADSKDIRPIPAPVTSLEDKILQWRETRNQSISELMQIIRDHIGHDPDEEPVIKWADEITWSSCQYMIKKNTHIVWQKKGGAK